MPENTFYKDIENRLKELKDNNLYKDIKVIESEQGAWIKVNGKWVRNFGSNNYLGAAAHLRVKEAAKKAIDDSGIGTTSTRPLAGNNILHIELEERLAKFKKVESVLLLQSGYMANIGAILGVLGNDGIAVSDELNHASIILALKAAKVRHKFIFKHADVCDLEAKLIEADKLKKALKNEDGKERIVMIITDTVFSMKGDLAPLPEIVKLAKKYGAMTMVDDAHGEGVLGDHGRGTIDHFGLHGEIDVEVGTLSKAFGVVGGFIAGKKIFIDYLWQTSHPLSFSNGLTMPDTGALIEVIKIITESDELVKKLWMNTNYLKSGFKNLGFDIGNSETPIIPVMFGDEELAAEFSRRLFENDVYATAIIFPMVQKGEAEIRVMPSAAHSIEDLDFALSKFAKIGKELGVL